MGFFWSSGTQLYSSSYQTCALIIASHVYILANQILTANTKRRRSDWRAVKSCARFATVLVYSVILPAAKHTVTVQLNEWRISIIITRQYLSLNVSICICRVSHLLPRKKAVISALV
ncbi:uncharacterized protein ARMOST_11590 [Armillaria ostoyae]|uniref:Uncharacterized protein n=1 Tax=Armillaria ostoyae TaxID=47428 RepID=A0A284RHM3_ARMOS|nr:uncharacterized protein ARMOST_11590 [Armillaria ostoyae]